MGDAGFEPGTSVAIPMSHNISTKNDLLSVDEKEELLAGLEPKPLLEDSAQLHHVHLRGHQPLHLHTDTRIIGWVDFVLFGEVKASLVSLWSKKIMQRKGLGSKRGQDASLLQFKK